MAAAARVAPCATSTGRRRRRVAPRAAQRRAAIAAGTGRLSTTPECGAIPGAREARSTQVPLPMLEKAATPLIRGPSLRLSQCLLCALAGIPRARPRRSPDRRCERRHTAPRGEWKERLHTTTQQASPQCSQLRETASCRRFPTLRRHGAVGVPAFERVRRLRLRRREARPAVRLTSSVSRRSASQAVVMPRIVPSTSGLVADPSLEAAPAIT